MDWHIPRLALLVEDDTACPGGGGGPGGGQRRGRLRIHRASVRAHCRNGESVGEGWGTELPDRVFYHIDRRLARCVHLRLQARGVQHNPAGSICCVVVFAVLCDIRCGLYDVHLLLNSTRPGNWMDGTLFALETSEER